MRVEETSSALKVKDLCEGDVFRYECCLYMKCSVSALINMCVKLPPDKIPMVRLSDGFIGTVCEMTEVKKVDGVFKEICL